MLLDVGIKGPIYHLVKGESMLAGEATFESHEPVDRIYEASRSLQEGLMTLVTTTTSFMLT